MLEITLYFFLFVGSYDLYDLRVFFYNYIINMYKVWGYSLTRYIKLLYKMKLLM